LIIALHATGEAQEYYHSAILRLACHIALGHDSIEPADAKDTLHGTVDHQPDIFDYYLIKENLP